MYEDEGEGFGYLMGEYLTSAFYAEETRSEVIIFVKPVSGNIAYPERKIEARVIGSDKPVRVIVR